MKVFYEPKTLNIGNGIPRTAQRIFRDERTHRIGKQKVVLWTEKNLQKTNKLIDEFFIFGSKRGGALAEKTQENYRFCLNEFFKFCSKEFDEITYDDIKNFYLKIRNKISDNSLEATLNPIKGFFRFLRERKYILENPADGFRIKSTKNNSDKIIKQIFTRQEIAKIIESCANPRDLAIISLLYGNGLRNSELCNLEISDIDLERGKITIEGKGKKRINDLLPNVVERLKLWLRVRGKLKTKKLFVTKFDNPLHTADIRNVVKKICKDAGVNKKITPHSFRHSMITHALEDGISLFEIASIVGHSSVDTTFQVYIHLAQMETGYLKKFRNF